MNHQWVWQHDLFGARKSAECQSCLLAVAKDSPWLDEPCPGGLL